MKVTFLGTGGSYPTPARNITAHYARVKGESLLFDCGEGTQRQLQRSGARFGVNRIFISHTDLDRVSGLPGYLGILVADLQRQDRRISGTVDVDQAEVLLVEELSHSVAIRLRRDEAPQVIDEVDVVSKAAGGDLVERIGETRIVRPRDLREVTVSWLLIRGLDSWEK